MLSMSTEKTSGRSYVLALVVLSLCAGAFAWPFLDGSSEREPTPRDPQGGVYDDEGTYRGARQDPASQRPPNFVVLVIDTLRFDAVDHGPGGRGLMPYTASLAARGVDMLDATAPAPWTVPSLTSFFSGLLPSVHGSNAPNRAGRLPLAVTTYAEVLRNSHGYETGAYTSGPWFGGQEPVLQGFTHGGPGFALQGTDKILQGFVSRRDPAKPFFLFLHSYEAHDPYGEASHPWPKPPLQPGRQSTLDLDSIREPWQVAQHFFTDRGARYDLVAARGAKQVLSDIRHFTNAGYRELPRPHVAKALRDAYEAGVRWVDGLIRSAVAQLKALGLLENTVLVVTSDHGEAFGEHGILMHGRQLYDELVHIPLILVGPAPFDGGRAIAGGVGLHDVLPTFLDHLGGAALPGVQGRSFLPLLRGLGTGRPVSSEERLDWETTGEDTEASIASVRSPRWKYIVTVDRLKGTTVEEAYDLIEDPGELRDLCGGSGRAENLPFDVAFCRAVQEARERVGGGGGPVVTPAATPYGQGTTPSAAKWPKACGP